MNPLQPTLIRDNLQYWLLPPDARLASHVRCYFVVDAGSSPYHHDELLLPDGYAEIVFALDAGFERWAVAAESDRRVMSRSYLIGGRSHSVLTGGSKRLKLVGVKLEPQALRSMIGASLAEFRDSTLELRDLNHGELLRLEDEVANASSVAMIAAALDRFFLRQLRDAAQDDAVDWLVKRIRGTRGSMSIADSISQLRLDPRTLERRFAAAVGMTPKKYARIVRFKHAYHTLLAQPAGAHHNDEHLDAYYDQSHFIREFRHFTGMSPSTLLARRTVSSTAVTDHLLRGDLAAAVTARSQ